MRIIEPSFDIINPVSTEDGVKTLQFIERMARISHRSEIAQTNDSWKTFIQFVAVTKGDWSVVEHSTATVIFRIDRGTSHELVRHRLFSFTQESTRFVNYKKVGEIDVIKPQGLTEKEESPWIESVAKACLSYTQMMDRGCTPQRARSVLPNALATTISVTGNLRNWRHFFLMRTTQETHPDFKFITIPLLGEFKKRIPLLYDDISPDVKQRVNLEKGR